MRHRATLLLFAFFLLAVSGSLPGPGTALAQSDGPYHLTWRTVNTGGYTFSLGGQYALGGTIGQFDAGLLAGGGFALGGGFWGSGAVSSHSVYLPLLLRAHDSP